MRLNVYVIDFIVEGVGDFPLDMLRYDECWPVGDADVRSISRTYASELEEGGARIARPIQRRQIKLRKYSQHGARPTRDRWESFGWKVSL